MRIEFLRTVALSTLLSITVWYIHCQNEQWYQNVSDNIIQAAVYPYIVIMLITIIINQFEAYTNIYTGCKYLGYELTIFNVLDILGWELIFMCLGYAPPFASFLASIHYGTGIASMFDRYYINHNYDKKYSIERCWKWFKVAFVFTDTITRLAYSMYITVILVLMVWATYTFDAI